MEETTKKRLAKVISRFIVIGGLVMLTFAFPWVMVPLIILFGLGWVANEGEKLQTQQAVEAALRNTGNDKRR